MMRDLTIPPTRVENTVPGAHAAEINSVAYSADGHTLASAGSGGTAKLWGTTGGQIKAKAEFPTSSGGSSQALMCVSMWNNDLLMAAGNDRTVRVWYDDERVYILYTVRIRGGSVATIHGIYLRVSS